MVPIKNKNWIYCLSYSLGVLTYSIELIYRTIPSFLPRIGRFTQVDEHIKSTIFLLWMSLFILVVLIFINKKINKHISFLITPYIKVTVSWYLSNYIPDMALYEKLGTTTGKYGVIFITPYFIYGVWIIPLVSYISAFLLLKLSSP